MIKTVHRTVNTWSEFWSVLISEVNRYAAALFGTDFGDGKSESAFNSGMVLRRVFTVMM